MNAASVVATRSRRSHRANGERSRGQVIVMFAGGLIFFIGLMAIVVDISWYWANTLRVQRAADAAALAGVVYLPGDPITADTLAKAEATKNGYVSGTGGVVLTDSPNVTNPRRLDVTLSAPIDTFFMRVFGISTITVSRNSSAEYVLPVPMGSPLNYFGDPNATDLNGNKLNFWAAIQGTNTAKENGDPYATQVMTPNGVANPEYIAPSPGIPGAYNYGIKVVAGSGPITVSLYDPEFCGRSSQFNDTGDVSNLYPGGGGSQVDTTFTLYDVSPTPLTYADDVALQSTTYPASCSSTYVSIDPVTGDYVGKWISFYTIAAPKPGLYRINVQTTLTGNLSNQFSIRAVASSGPQPELYGLGSMSIYANMNSGITNLYLAQIAANYAGKTVEIRLFDPGDANGNASLGVLIPTGANTYAPVSFTYFDAGVNGTSTAPPSGPTTTLVTTQSGNRYYNGHWVVLRAVIPSAYTGPGNGWWKIQYNYSGGAAHDRTTWRVDILGNPVHLVVP
ncbi:MAG: pilus assembly protein TadG-related protein [Candidatus Limnocylindrales bacterium]